MKVVVIKRLVKASFFFIALHLVSCANEVTENKIKDYRLYLFSEDTAVREHFNFLVNDFNERAGLQALKLMDNVDDANSPIILTPGLQKSTGDKVGWGQWMTETKENHPVLGIGGQKTEREITYSMRIELDKDYVYDRLGNDETKRYGLEKLFYHEVGHGLQMDHDEVHENNVMYPELSGTKDFDAFFVEVREFFQDN